MRGTSTTWVVTYDAVVLFAVAPSTWPVTPTSGSHWALGTLASSVRAVTRASPARISG